jgi:hypothetical protein
LGNDWKQVREAQIAGRRNAVCTVFGVGLRDAYVPNRRVRLASNVATICAVGLLLGLLGSAVTWWGRSALFDLAESSRQTVKMGTGYLFGPVLILAALPLMLGRVGQVVLTRWYRVRLGEAILLWAAGIAVLISKVSGLHGYTIKAGTFVVGVFLVVGLISTLTMWPSGLRVVKVDRKGNVDGSP